MHCFPMGYYLYSNPEGNVCHLLNSSKHILLNYEKWAKTDNHRIMKPEKK